jgi:hypothetical protein
MTGWTRATNQVHCLLCDGPDNCEWMHSENGNIIYLYCGRISDGSRKENSNGQYLHHLDRFGNIIAKESSIAGGQRQSRRGDKQPFKVARHTESLPLDDINNRVQREAACEAQWIDKLACSLGVSAESLRRLDVGYSPARDKGHGAWGFPEKDDSGQFVGINYRTRSGKKRRLRNSQCGLIYPVRWKPVGNRPILLPEGGSDVAAGLTMGICVVGRPSCNAKAELLADLLKDIGGHTDIIVLGENDLRRHTNLNSQMQQRHNPCCSGCMTCWPGKYGAVSVAGKMMERLGRAISCALPPDGFKDIREWLNANTNDGDAGAEFVSRLQLIPLAAPQVARVPVDYRPVIPLNEWRQEIRKRKLASLGTPGVWLDGSPTGAGKSHSDVAAAVAIAETGGRSLIVAPTHGNGEEIVTLLHKSNISASKFSRRITASSASCGDCVNCWNIDADTAESFGLPVIETVCAGCPHQFQCKDSGYLKVNATTHEATVVVATHARGIYASLDELATGREFVSIHENPLDLLKPTFVTRLDDLECAAELLGGILAEEKSALYPHDGNPLNGDTIKSLVPPGGVYTDPDRIAAISRLSELANWLVSEVSTSTGGRLELPTDVAENHFTVSSEIFRLILAKLKTRQGASRASRHNSWQCLVALSEGDFCHVDVMMPPAHNSADTEQRRLVVVRNNPLPIDSATIWLNDATLSLEDAMDAVGGPVVDATPEGRLQNMKCAVQIPHDFTQKTSAKSVCDMFRGFLAKYPEFQRIGIIGHRKHLDALGKVDPSRVVMATYFHSGDDRASNDWHHKCDAVVIFGTPRVPASAIQLHLIRLGRPARSEESNWGEWRWGAQTTTGKQRIVHGHGYREASWRTAHNSIVRANLIQAIGRARAILDDGIPVYVFSDEECGIPLSDESDDVLPVTEEDVALIETVASIAAASLGGRATTAQIAVAVTRPERTVSRKLQELWARKLIASGGATGIWIGRCSNDTV